jgi:hypothetical protein
VERSKTRPPPGPIGQPPRLLLVRGAVSIKEKIKDRMKQACASHEQDSRE